MDIATSYELQVPKDAIVAIETAGLLGQSYVDIDVSQASGAPIEKYGHLKSRAITAGPSAEELVKAMTTAIIEACKGAGNTPKSHVRSSSPLPTH